MWGGNTMNDYEAGITLFFIGILFCLVGFYFNLTSEDKYQIKVKFTKMTQPLECYTLWLLLLLIGILEILFMPFIRIWDAMKGELKHALLGLAITLLSIVILHFLSPIVILKMLLLVGIFCVLSAILFILCLFYLFNITV